jgi:hypothetical protein
MRKVPPGTATISKETRLFGMVSEYEAGGVDFGAGCATSAAAPADRRADNTTPAFSDPPRRH